MNLHPATAWWVAAGVLVALELGLGTFYLLMVALGLCAGAIAAHLGLGLTGQIVAAALVGGGATALWHLRRRRGLQFGKSVADNPDVFLDVGEPVHVDAWTADRTARVQYRGTTWTARLAPGVAPMPGRHRVAAVEGNWLVLAPAAAPA